MGDRKAGFVDGLTTVLQYAAVCRDVAKFQCSKDKADPQFKAFYEGTMNGIHMVEAVIRENLKKVQNG